MRYLIGIAIVIAILLNVHIVSTIAPITDIGVLALLPVPTPVVENTQVISKPTAAPDLIPRILSIPTIKLKAPIVAVGVASNGKMDTPSEFGTVGWYKAGYKPGDTGNAVIDGHVDSKKYGEAVFYHLKDLYPGDIVMVDEIDFIVMKVVTYDKDQCPTQEIFGNQGYRGLNLITCTGTYNKAKYGGHNQRLVVYCRLEISK